MKRIAFALATLLAAPAMAQTVAPVASPGVSSSKDLWANFTSNITKSAEQMPESDYSFKPVATVRSFGQLIGHVAGAQYMFCALALGEPARAEGDVESKVTTKAGLVVALKASTEYCQRAYAQTDAGSAAPIKMFGQDRTRMYALIMNAAHNAEHYGNLVTYMRVKGMVPPSSQPRPGM